MAASRTRLLVACLLAALPLTAACQQILGLDQYEKADAAADAGADADADVPDADVPDVSLPDAFYKPTAWADSLMPNPSFDSGSDALFNTVSYLELLDASIPDASVRFAIRDTTAGGPNRTWLKTPSSSSFATEALAETYCGSLGATIGGKWRLPTRIELVALIDFTRTPAIDPLFLESAKVFWTSSPYRPYDPKLGLQYWTVNFGDPPSVRPSSGQIPYFSLCVADTQ